MTKTRLIPIDHTLYGQIQDGTVLNSDQEGTIEFFDGTACALVRNRSREVLRQGDIVAWLEFGKSVIRFPPGRLVAGIVMAITVEPMDLFWLAIKNNVAEHEQSAVQAAIEASIARLALTPQPASANNSDG